MDGGNNVCDAYCKKCFYFQGQTDATCSCCYILITGQKRPCDPGKGCAVRKKRKSARRLKEDRENERK